MVEIYSGKKILVFSINVIEKIPERKKDVAHVNMDPNIIDYFDDGAIYRLYEPPIIASLNWRQRDTDIMVVYFNRHLRILMRVTASQKPETVEIRLEHFPNQDGPRWKFFNDLSNEIPIWYIREYASDI